MPQDSKLENVASVFLLLLAVMAAFTFGDWLTRDKQKPYHWYCQSAEHADHKQIFPSGDAATNDEKKARKQSDEKNHELCQQWRSAEAAVESAHVAWLQLWIGFFGLTGLVGTIIYTARAAMATAEAANHASRSVEMQLRLEKPFIHIDHTGIIAPRDFPDHIVVPVKNSGNSLAVLIDYVICAAVADHVLSPKPQYHSKPRTLDGRLLDKGASTKLVWIFIPETPTKALYEDDRNITIWGYLRYEDVFGRVWKRGFALKTFIVVIADQANNGTIVWERAGGAEYNYDREERDETSQRQRGTDHNL